jgi:hypothetical protein
MSRLQRKSFDEPETVRQFPHGTIVSVSLDETVLGEWRFEPGWRWSNDVRPIVGTDLCQNRHVGVCLEGGAARPAGGRDHHRRAAAGRL